MNKQELIEFIKEQLKIEMIDDGSFLTVKNIIR